MRYVQRTLENFLNRVGKQFPVFLVTGLRQVGKTRMLKHMSKDNRGYVTLDNIKLRNLANEEPELFLQRFKPPLLIDEIQYAPQLLPYIKIHVDTHKEPGAFWLTGSQQFHMMKNVSESLAGRVGIVNLLGLSLRESTQNTAVYEPFLPVNDKLSERFTTHIDLLSLYTKIWRGSFPAIALDLQADRDIFYDSYVQTYLERDIRDLAHVGDLGAFLKFLRAAAARTGQLLNLSDMARDADISPITAKKWLSILEASGMIYLLEPYYHNVTKRLIKAPKLYFLDTGLASYLTEWSSPEALEAGAMSGAILETFCFTEILKSYWHNGKRAPLYYYRDKDKVEIDLLIFQNNTLYPIEFKKTAMPGKGDVKHFPILEKLGMQVGEGGVVCLVDQIFPITAKIRAIPISCL